MDRDFLLYKLRNIGISGKFYHAVKALYQNSKSRVQLNNLATEWFDVTNGVRQGDSLSPTLFSIYLNDLAEEIKSLNAGVNAGDACISLLLYADDIVLIAPTAEKLQSMLNIVAKWCGKWSMQINDKKTQVLHARNHQRPRSSFQFKCGKSLLDYTSSYKYLGYIIDEHLNETKNVETLTASASRSFGRMHSIFKQIRNMGVKSYETLYNSYDDPIMNYVSGVWGFAYFNTPQVLQNRIIRFYLGVHRYAPTAVIKIEMDWLECRGRRWLNILRLYNRINIMDRSRLPKIVYDWDVRSETNSWSSEVKQIAAKLGFDTELSWGETYDLTMVYNKLLKFNRSTWHLQTTQKPKLRTFIKVHDFDSCQIIVKAPLTRLQRSLVVQLKIGILPLKYETDRYQGIAPENRICKLCNLNVPEDECHFLFSCPALHITRERGLEHFRNLPLGSEMDNIQRLTMMLTSENIAVMGTFIESLFKERKKMIYA